MMRRWIGVATVLGLLAMAPPPAEAGLGSLFKMGAKLGSKGGAKAGAAGAKVGAKGAATAGAKGVATLGAVAVADDVFRHVASDAGRMGVYVADAGDGTLAAVVRGGDGVVEPSGSLSRIVDEVAYADDAPGFPIDVYVDRDVVQRMDSLEVPSDTTLYLANKDGPSRPLRSGDRGPEVGITDDLWANLKEEIRDAALEMVLESASEEFEAELARIVVVDASCEGEGVEPSVEAAVAASEPGDLTVVVTTALRPADEVRTLAEDAAIDLVLVHHDGVCAEGPGIEAVVRPITEAETLGDLWTAHASADDPAVLDTVDAGEWDLLIASASVVASHGTAAPPWWAQAVANCLCCGCPFMALAVLVVGIVGMMRRTTRTAE